MWQNFENGVQRPNMQEMLTENRVEASETGSKSMVLTVKYSRILRAICQTPYTLTVAMAVE